MLGDDMIYLMIVLGAIGFILAWWPFDKGWLRWCVSAIAIGPALLALIVIAVLIAATLIDIAAILFR